jgi:hypothetical protein
MTPSSQTGNTASTPLGVELPHPVVPVNRGEYRGGRAGGHNVKINLPARPFRLARVRERTGPIARDTYSRPTQLDAA